MHKLSFVHGYQSLIRPGGFHLHLIIGIRHRLRSEELGCGERLKLIFNIINGKRQLFLIHDNYEKLGKP